MYVSISSDLCENTDHIDSGALHFAGLFPKRFVYLARKLNVHAGTHTYAICPSSVRILTVPMKH